MKMALSVLLTLVATLLSMHPTMAQDATRFELLWPKGAPGALGDKDADKPGVWVYPAAKPNGAAIVICPGGGYGFLANDHEGKQVAEFFVKHGVTAFVLKYRIVAKDRPGPLLDALYRWTAQGEELNQIPEGDNLAGLVLEFHVVLN